MTSTIAGIFLPGRLIGTGSLFALGGEMVDHEQGAREVALIKYKIGFMRADAFNAVHRVGFDD